MKRRAEEYAAKYPALAKRRSRGATPLHDFSRVLVGHDQDGRPVFLDERSRLEMMHVVGTTGSGKTTFFKNLALQDFRRGRGGLVIDPHGSHPGSLYSELVAELEADGFFKSGRVHLIDPNLRSHVVPVNFLAQLDDTDISVLADAMLQAVERVWGDEDTHQKPAIRSNLKAAFMALPELGLPLTDAKLLFDPDDTHGVRARAIQSLDNEYARDELARLHRIAASDRTRREFNLEVRGPINRLNEFVSSDVMRAMLGVTDEPGRPRRTFDLLRAMDKGEIVLCNLQHGAAVSEADANLLGALLLRYLFLLASRRRNSEPFFVYVDEAHRYVTGDVPSILAECRKYGIAAAFGHQFLAQLGKPDDLHYRAMLDCTEIHVVFRVKSAEEAQRLAEHVLPLSLERPVHASVRPTAIGQRRVQLESSSTSRSQSVSEGVAETDGEMHAATSMHSTSDGVGSTTSTSVAEGSFDGTGDSAGMLLTPPMQLFGPNHSSAALVPMPLSQSTGSIASRGASQQTATAEGESRMQMESRGSAETHARSHARTRSVGETRGRSETAGASEGFESVYADLPASFHSKEHELYFAGEMIRALPVGQAFVSWRGTTHRITIPPPKRQS